MVCLGVPAPPLKSTSLFKFRAPLGKMSLGPPPLNFVTPWILIFSAPPLPLPIY